MFNKKLFLLIGLLKFLILSSYLTAQVQADLFIVSGGAFSDPDDFVEITKYDPVGQDVTPVNTIYTQAVQDIVADDDFLFIAALDSLVKVDQLTGQKVAVTAASGTNLLMLHEDLVFMSVQYPETSGYLKVFDAQTLELLHTVDGISGETAGMLILNNILYLAVPGAYGTETGSIALIDLADFQLIEEIDLGEGAKGIFHLLELNGKILCVNKTAYGESVGTLSLFDPESKTAEHYSFNHSFGKAVLQKDNQLYLFVDNGLGIIDLNQMSLSEPQFIPDPGSTNYIYFAAMVYDSVHEQFYATTTDYFSFGQGTIYGLDGIQKGTFEAGISAEAMTVVVDQATDIPDYQAFAVKVYPNPFTDNIVLENSELLPFSAVRIFDYSGKIVRTIQTTQNSSTVIKADGLPAGFYILEISTSGNQVFRKKIIKH